jgi:alpha-beta hydrolase superfamily lysophospholipase
VDREISFDQSTIGDDLPAYLRASEAQFDDITPGVEKQIVWAGDVGAQTDLAVVYIHGYSATSEEIRPVPDLVAKALGANLYFTRLRGHGRSGPAMVEAEAGDWIEDMAEAIAIGRRIGREVIALSTSTGGTISAIAATDPSLADGIKGITFISPNFRIKNHAAVILTWPLVRYWAPVLVGPERSFEPINDGQRKYWTTRYPTKAVMPMAALVAHADAQNYSDVKVPALFMFSDADAVVSSEKTREMALRWGGDTTVSVVALGPGDDPFNHVIAGDILSPGQTEETVVTILEWVKGLK